MWVADAPTQLNSHAGGCRPYPSVRSYPDEIELVRVPGFLRQWIRVIQDPCVGGWKSHGQGQGQPHQDNGSTRRWNLNMAQEPQQPYPKLTMLPPPLGIVQFSDSFRYPAECQVSCVSVPPSQTQLAQ